MSALSNPFCAHFSVHSQEWSCSPFFDRCFDDHGSLVIFRSASVRPKHLFDQDFDHDYYFKLPFQGAGCPIHMDGALLHAMDGTELSRVRTEL